MSAIATSPYPAEREVDVVLRDGSTLHVRPVRPHDEEAILAFLEGLSLESRWFRFFSAASNLGWAARWAVDVDYADTYGLVALTGEDERVVGHATYTRTGKTEAEISFATADVMQGLGLATILLAHLAEAATEHDIATFVATVLPENHRMIEVFRDSGFPVDIRSHPDELHVELPTSLSPAARERFEERDHNAAVAAVAGFLRPRSVALVGASRKPLSIGGALVRNLREAAFTGELHLVNRQGGSLDGVPLHRSLADIEGAVDLAVVAVPAAGVVPVARECAKKGVRSLVVVSAGFSEAGEEGARRQRELLAVCRSAGMRLVGPNCLGILNTAPDVGLNATFAPTLPPAGGIAFMSQSGGVGIAVLEHARTLGLGLSSFVSVGNKADVSGNDFLRYWEEDDATRAVLLYLESFGNPRKFARIARRVGERKPILALKSGRSRAGARAAGSHTGALLAASDVTVDALFEQAGVIRADTMGELFDVAALLSNQPLPTGGRVAVLTNAGGPGILCADALEANGLEVPSLSAATQARLREFLPPEAAVANPVDLIAGASARDFRRALDVLSSDAEVDAMIVLFVPPIVTRAQDVAAAIADGVRELPRRIPVQAVFMTDGGPPEELQADERNVPGYAFPEDAARALGRAAAYAAWRQAPRGRVPELRGIRRDEAAAVIAGALAEGGGWLNPERVDALCSCYGIPIAQWRAAATPHAAGRAAHALGGPVALKAVARTLVHKTEAGGVRIGLVGESAVRRAARRMREDVTRHGHDNPTFLVQEMVPDGVEMLVGVIQDAQFGPVLACGAGGTAVELVHDVAVRITPVTDRDVHEMVCSLQTFALLDSYRGAPRCDVAALEQLLLRISALVEAHHEIAEMDCNPVVVTPDGATSVDVRIRVEEAAPERPQPSVDR